MVEGGEQGMRSVVTFVFGPEQTLEVPVDIRASALGAMNARAWFEDAWVSLGCEPTRPSGKVLLLDKILSVTEALGYADLLQDNDSAYELAFQVALALEKPAITIDLVDQTVGF